MKKILIFVSTLDGKITKWGDPHIRSWSSKKDQDHFDAIWNNTRVIIMGSGTYKPEPVTPVSNHLFIVITRYPKKFKEKNVTGQLEFTNESASRLVKRFEHEGEEILLIVGGPQIATIFLKQKLIDELWLTFEPKIFGAGGNFVVEEKLDISLHLLSSEKVNDQGTLINKYKVDNQE
jgi:dihydrofolate reductase